MNGARRALLQSCLQGLADAPHGGLPDAAVRALAAPLQALQAGADEVLLAAAGLGLFPPAGTACEPGDSVGLLPLLRRRGHAIRCGTSADLEALLRLESACWPEALRSAPQQLAGRLATHPEDQLVLVHEGAVTGVIYSQRIPEGRSFDGVTAASVDALHDAGGAVAQLIAINVAPEVQHLQLGDELLEFMLVWRRLQGLRTVVAISRCRDFDPATGASFGRYIHARNPQGVVADPILRFHELHGARIEAPVPGYRPADHANQGCGVLVRYDLLARRRTDADATPAAPVPAAGVLRSEIASTLREALGAQAAGYADDRPLMEMGLDSADVLALRDRLGHRFGLALPAGFFFEHNTVAKMVRALAAPVEAAQSAPAPAALQPGAEPVAIVGIACRLPGGIDTLDGFAQALDAGRSLIGPLPAGRWQWPPQVEPQGRHVGIDRGGFLADVDAFDAPFFRISPAEAQAMDPQQRMLLELCWEAVEQAGHDPLTLAGTDTGVFVGAGGCDYARLQEQSALPVEAHHGTGQSLAVLANRVSYFLDLHGPSLVLDTACSASLVAVHEAIRSLRAGECSQALAGGINLLLHPASSIAYHQSGMLARDGVCRTFDADAGGYVRSEGAVVFLLKPLAAARAAGDHVHAVLLGSACRHGGRAGGLTVPHPGQQARLLQAAWRDAGVAPGDIGYIEAHGTGTPLGDPIEVQGIRQARAEALGAGVRPDGFACGIGSVKSQFGHLEAAAGAVGLLKAVLALAHERIAPTLHFRRLNPQIALAGSGLHVVERPQAWPRGGARRVAGVSSFGSGGTNAHVVVAEAPAGPGAGPADAGPVLVLLSARNRERLQAQAARLADWLASPAGAGVPLAQLAWQLQAGRSAMEERLALVADGRDGLIEHLRQCAAGDAPATASPTLHSLLEGEAGRAFLGELFAARDLERLGALWTAGATIDWTPLHPPAYREQPRRVALPTYPFARHRYWIGRSAAVAAGPPAPQPQSGTAALPPLVLAPHWRPHDGPAPPLQAGRRVVVVGATSEAVDELRRGHPTVHDLPHAAGADIGALARELQALGPIDDVLWLAPSDPAADALLPLFRLVKALLHSGASERPLRLTVVTTRTQAVAPGEAPRAGHAGVHGLAGALAQEHPRWLVRAIDVDGPVALRVLLEAPRHAACDVLAHRAGQFLQRRFVPADLPPAPLPWRQGGVYLVVGGAGGLGQAWTRHVVAQCQAQVIWVGRRAPDADIEAAIASIARIGPAPVYVPADAADPQALQGALAQVRARWPVLHGVVVAAVGAFDRSIAQTDESQLRAVLAAKVDAGVNLARLLQADPPRDFLLFFSSIVALEKAGGHAGYAAGGAFQDALALQLAQSLPCRVQVVDWGHWAIGTGAAIPEAAKVRRAQRGDLLLEPATAFAALESLLSAPWPQAAVLGSTRPEALDFVDPGQRWSADAAAPPLALPMFGGSGDAPAPAPALEAASVFNNAALEAELRQLLLASLQALDLLGSDPHEGVAPGARAWLQASLAHRSGVAVPALAQAWSRWDAAKATTLAAPDLRAAVTLAEACLRALPEILRGSVPATDILFPGGSMERVEGIYRGNAVADHFNACLADVAHDVLARRLEQDPGARLRVLEIGAGTGGTTALVLPRLALFGDRLAEYAYTDVSKAFLFHAEEKFVPGYPFVQPRRFDVEQPPQAQGIEAHCYDLVLATNVLHATRDIRRTLAHAKAALRGGGVLLLNEISTPSLFAHVTFGLLDGWWLATDRELRMPGSPGLAPQRWAEVLRQAGFGQAAFPCAAAHVLGQQLVVAQSDGVILQPRVPRTPPAGDRSVAAPAPAQGGASTLAAACRVRLGAAVARVLRMPADAVETNVPLGDYGLDSILLVQLAEALREHLPRVSRTLLFEARTVDALAERLLAEQRADVENWLGAAPRAPATAAPAQLRAAAAPMAARQTPADEPIAIIGLSCRFGPADDAEAYWDLLRSGRSAIGEIPPDRWPLEGFYHPDPDEAVRLGRSYSRWGAFLRDVHAFDPLFFHILPREAATIDPQERLFLQAAWHALQDAGYTRERVRRDGGQLGVFAGITRTGFDLFGPALWQHGHTAYPHTSFSSAANRVSFFLDAHGPSLPVDTMCSSSLAAIHQACQSLRAGECRVALAGGVNVFLHPSSYVGLSAARMLSPDGTCRSFGDGANGFVPGEGVAALLLKPLAQAVADGDPVHALIRGTHINHGGRTHGYTVPNPQAQSDLVAETLRKAGIDARDVSYMEAHGTGTALGDPIEIAALTRAFRTQTRDEGFCAIGSAKSQVGHCEAAAGMAGVVKLVLQMQHGEFAPTLNAARRNPEIDFARTPFVLQDNAAPWPRPRVVRDGVEREVPRIGGVSSFGAGGTNAHVLLQEYEAPVRATHPAAPVPVLLSARNGERLVATARRLEAFLARRVAQGAAPALADIAYTLQAGREPMEERLAFVAASVPHLVQMLQAWIAGAAGAQHANVRQHREVTAKRSADGATAQAVAAAFAADRHEDYLPWWTQGLEIDWEKLHAESGSTARRVHLPGYAFDTTAYALPAVPPTPAVSPVPVHVPPPAAATTAPRTPLAAAPDIALAPPAALAKASGASLDRPTFALAPLAAFSSTRVEAPDIATQERGEGVWALRLCGSREADGAAALRAWRAAVARLGPAPRVLLLEGLEHLAAGTDSATLEGWRTALAGGPQPVIAVLQGAVPRAAMEVAEHCALRVFAAGGRYALFGGTSVAGDALRAHGVQAQVVDDASLAQEALALAHTVARGSAIALAGLQSQFARPLPVVGASPDIDVPAAAPLAPPAIVRQWQVLTLERAGESVALVRMHDRAARNCSSPALVAALEDVFAAIAATPAFRVVVLTGFDTYFACGGTREGLLAIQGGAARFTDEQTYALPLQCDLPVIAAMQGHAIGAGWALGLFCDAALYAAEGMYQSPYMLYGFTPGAGSTCIFPLRLGRDLGCEVLLTAREYRGRELLARGLAAQVLPRTEVLPRALALAQRWAAAPRVQLVADKAARVATLRAHLPTVFAQELALHQRNFLDNPDVIARIERHFKAALPVAAAPATAVAPADGARLVERLRASLAEELALPPAEVHAEQAFIDLGIDSISAVTWVRRLNREFGLDLPATLVYRHPTLAQLATALASQVAASAPVAVSAPPAALPPPGDLGGQLRASLAAELLLAPEELDDERSFLELGLDSVNAVSWVRAINARFGLDVPATIVYRHPTLGQLRHHLQALLADSPAPAAEPAAPPPPVQAQAPLVQAEPGPAPAAEPARVGLPAVAIVGMSGRFPQAPDVRTFWRNLLAGRDCVAEIPAARWSIADYHDTDRQAPGKTVCRRMGALDDVDRFDSLFFRIAPAEAELMDPQQRLFLQESWRAVEDAGYDPGSLAGRACGVFVGCTTSDYAKLATGLPPSAQGLTGETLSMLPARVAYFLDLQGPCMAIDTACSASLVAIANGCDSLALGHSEVALAGGVYVINGPDIQVKMSQAGMLSPDGRCHSFDARANGFVPGEGVAVLVLKRLEDAERDGDDVYAVIRGWGVNQDGRTNGITAPSQPAQARLQARVYEQFGIDPGQIGLVEAHGTGTPLGDPIEVEALCESFRLFTAREGYCALGSVKSNIGHLATAAGVAGVIKGALALEQRTLPPTIHFERLNDHIALAGSPFFINTQAREWPSAPGQPRLAAVSSFGFSGTNAHLVLQAAPERRPAATAQPAPMVLPLSAHDPQQLRIAARELADFLAGPGQAVPLHDVAHTLQVGRAQHSCRLAVVGTTHAELQGRLAGYAQAGAVDADCVDGASAAAAAADGGAREAVRRQARAWVGGGPAAWTPLPGARRRHGLPTYPFARERHWIAPPAPAGAASQVAPVPAPEAMPAAWQPAPLPAADWAARLRAQLARPLLVASDDADLPADFDALLRQMRQACELADSGAVAHCRLADVGAALERRPAQLLVVGDAGLVAAASPALRALPAHAQVLVLATADEAAAATLRACLQHLPDAVLVTQDVAPPPRAGVQRLLREWLLAGDPPQGVRQLRYRIDERFALASPAPAAQGAWRAHKRWRERAAQAAHPAPVRGALLVLVNQESLQLARHLLEPQDFARVVLVADSSVASHQVQNAVDLSDATAARISAQLLLEQHPDLSHLLDLSDLRDRPCDSDAASPGKLLLLQALVTHCTELSVLHVTQDLQPWSCSHTGLAGARFASLVRVLHAEHRHVLARTVDIDASLRSDAPALREVLLREFDAALQEPELCYRDGARFVPVLELLPPAAAAAPAMAPEGVYVVSGGTRGVGLALARHLVRRGARRLVLMGVVPLPPRDTWARCADDPAQPPARREVLRGLLALAADVETLEVYTGSLAHRETLQRCFDDVRARLGPLRGVVHCAGVYSDAARPGFAAKSLDGMQRVWEPKAQGLQQLQAVLAGDPLDFFVTVSSLAGLLPSLARGASDYAMAHGFVDFAMAWQRRHDPRGVLHRNVFWADWNDTGAFTRVAPDKAAAAERAFAAIGLRSFDSEEGCALFDLAMAAAPDAAVLVGLGDRAAFERALPTLLHARPGEIPAAPAPDALRQQIDRWEAAHRKGQGLSAAQLAQVIGLDDIRKLEPALIHRIHGLLQPPAPPPAVAADDPAQAVAALVSDTVVEVLKLKRLAPGQTFQSQGLDSISAMVVATRLEKKLGRAVQASWLVEHCTAQALARHLLAVDAEPQ